MATKRRKKGKYRLESLFFVILLYANIFECVQTLYCYCDPCHETEANNTCLMATKSMCFVSINIVRDTKHPDGIEEWSFGCLPPDESSILQCKLHLVPSKDPQSIICCNQSDFCNKHLQPVYRDIHDTTIGSISLDIRQNQLTKVALFVSISCCVILLVVIAAFVYLRYRRREMRRQQLLDDTLCTESFLPRGGEMLKDFISQSQSSGSGAGIPIMLQRTIAKEIFLCNVVGKGRYSEVWRGQWRNENVAVKIFYTTDEASWYRETELYQTVLLRHDNILGFIAADIRGTASSTQLWLITDYHENSSLYDYLQATMVSMDDMLCKIVSIARGLAHLHSEIFGSNGKPAIAHRDIKSKNILVKTNGECCIADLGLAVRFFSETKVIDEPANTRQGTKRYMAPEVLSETLCYTSFDAYLQADMYSFGLVLWETANRCHFAADSETSMDKHYVPEHEIPFEHCVSSDPSFDEMRALVCVENRRPAIPDHWSSQETMRTLSKLIGECWHACPTVRLTAVRVKKTLTAILESQCSSDKKV